MRAVRARPRAGEGTVRGNSTTPPADPVRSCVSRPAGAVVPLKATISRCPTRRPSGTCCGGGADVLPAVGAEEVGAGGAAADDPGDELPLHAAAARQSAAVGSARFTGPAYGRYQVFQQRSLLVPTSARCSAAIVSAYVLSNGIRAEPRMLKMPSPLRVWLSEIE